MRTGNKNSSRLIAFTAALAILISAQTTLASAPSPSTMTDEEITEWVGKVVGPERFDNNCASCHALEAEAWQNTRHYATFKERHRSDEAKQILEKLGQKSMKRAGECRDCHYTSIIKREKISATWGVSCESCHSPSRDWNEIHNKVGGIPTAETIKWGTGKNESPEARATRLAAAHEAGMIHSNMIYDIASNCFGCHTVPNESIVNQGGHRAGSDFDLLTWSQGEVRHNFSSSAGAPDNPTNRKPSAERKRILYVVGALVDLETTLRNLTAIKEQGGAYHTAMVERANRVRAKVDAILSASSLPAVAAAVANLPNPIDQTTEIPVDLHKALGNATRELAETSDGSDLNGVDTLLPTEIKGTPHKE